MHRRPQPLQATQTVIPWSILPAQVVYQRDESAAVFPDGDKGEHERQGVGVGGERGRGGGSSAVLVFASSTNSKQQSSRLLPSLALLRTHILSLALYPPPSHPSPARNDQGRRFAVGLASLGGHLLAGEERFAVELHSDGSVWYDVFLFSKPNTLLAWFSLPVIKLMQLRYVNDSIAAVARRVA